MSLFRGFQEVAPLFRLLDDYAVASTRRGFPSAVSSIRAFQPKFDVREVKDSYELHGELPGIAQKDIDVEWEDGQTLVIKGHSQRLHEDIQTDGAATQTREGSQHNLQATVEDSPDEPATPASTEVVSEDSRKVAAKTGDEPKYWVTERSIGEFRRSWTFPSRVDQDNVRASLKDGILSIIVPKASRPQPRKIAIE